MAESVKKNQTSRLLEVRNSAGGQIVEVEGGHIIRSIGKKDRHSKVCTAKGPRDRRVRLSAHTAIQFYDVQDRLGYDRPSKAVDWLIKKAKSAIDELGVLPSAMVWQLPAATEEHSPNSQLRPRFEQASHDGQTHLNSDSIVVDTLKPFFPMAEVSSSQDLCLSLQSLKDSTTLLQPAQVHHSREQMYNPVSLESSMGVGWSSGQHSSTVGWLDQQSGGDQTISWYTTSPALSHQDQQQFSEYLSSQRGPLQSADFCSVSASLDHPTYQQSYSVDHPSTIGFSSFLFSAGSQCQEEGSHDMTNKFHLCPLSTSSTL